MSGFAGLRGTGHWGVDERPKNFREYILWKNPNGSAPIFALTSKASKETVDDPEFSWFEERLSIFRTSINFATGYTATATALTITSGGLSLAPGDVIQVEKVEGSVYDNELVEVAGIGSDTVISVIRGVAGTTAAGIAHGTFLTRIGCAFQEGTVKPEISQRNPVKLRNFTQIFKTSVGITGTANSTYARTGDAFKNDKKRNAFKHSVQIETAFLFGRAFEDLSGPRPKRYTGGLRSLLTTNVTIFTTTPTEDTFLNAIFRVFDWDSEAGNQRIMFAGNGFLNALNRLSRASPSSRITFKEVITLYGMSLQRWILPQGEIAVRTHPLLNHHTRYTNSAFVIDPTGLIYRPLKGRDTKFTDNVQLPGQDSREGQWITECGLEVQHEPTMAYIGNFIV